VLNRLRRIVPADVAFFATVDPATLLFTTAGSFTGNGDSFGALTGIWAGTGEPIQLDATADSELLQVRFPAASSHITLTPDERSLDAPQSI